MRWGLLGATIQVMYRLSPIICVSANFGFASVLFGQGILLIFDHFLSKYGAESGSRVVTVGSAGSTPLQRYSI